MDCRRCHMVPARTELMLRSGEQLLNLGALCNACIADVQAFIEAGVPMPEFDDLDDDDIDDCEHHAACMCHECDPDFWMDLARDHLFEETAA